MTNKKFWPGMLIMAFVFGMAVVSCSNETTPVEDNSTNIFGSLNLRITVPDFDELTSVGLAEFEFENIRDAVGRIGTFQGWEIDYRPCDYNEEVIIPFIWMAWAEQNEDSFDYVINALNIILGIEGYVDTDAPTFVAEATFYRVYLYTMRIVRVGGDYYYPEGALFASVWR